MTGGDHRDCVYYFEDEDRFKCRKGHPCFCRFGETCEDMQTEETAPADPFLGHMVKAFGDINRKESGKDGSI